MVHGHGPVVIRSRVQAHNLVMMVQKGVVTHFEGVVISTEEEAYVPVSIWLRGKELCIEVGEKVGYFPCTEGKCEEDDKDLKEFINAHMLTTTSSSSSPTATG
ncbi:hypothetical protein DRH29_00250 [candidate division Kazan bacterium]|uniref:Uncharacterized protein n=1 Tax=candidate division Kazan bacterium TaxID=2202143 RepID=A0A420ZDU3_UNCK3|nr:MAG: hypothetical protein DRH29_00250 [candidate division Kazan bacterium]